MDKQIKDMQRIDKGLYKFFYEDGTEETKEIDWKKAQSIRFKLMHARKKQATLESEAEHAKMSSAVDAAETHTGQTLKSATPSSPKRQGAKTWQESGILPVSGKDPDYAYKWCRKQNVSKRLDQGWELCQKGEVNTSIQSPFDGEATSSLVIKREMVLMKLHKDAKAMRTKKYLDKIIYPNDIEKAFYAKTGGNAYGRIIQGRG